MLKVDGFVTVAIGTITGDAFSADAWADRDVNGKGRGTLVVPVTPNATVPEKIVFLAYAGMAIPFILDGTRLLVFTKAFALTVEALNAARVEVPVIVFPGSLPNTNLFVAIGATPPGRDTVRLEMNPSVVFCTAVTNPISPDATVPPPLLNVIVLA